MLIAIEAIDAAGKNTQAKLLNDWLNENWPESSTLTSFPDYSSPTGKMILSLLKEEWWQSFETWPGQAQIDADRALLLQALMTQNRYEKYQMLVSKKHSPYHHLVCDRYFASGLVYGQADGLSLDYLRGVHDALPSADLWILIDITAEESVRRRPIRRDEYEKRAGFMEAVREKYLALFKQPPHDGSWVVINGMQSPEDVHRAIIATVTDQFGHRIK